MQVTQINKSLLPSFLKTSQDECRYSSPKRINQTPPKSLKTKNKVQYIGLSPISTNYTTTKTNKSTIFEGSPGSPKYDNSITKSFQIVKPKVSQVPVVRETIIMQNKIGEEQNQKIISNLLLELDQYKTKCNHLELHLFNMTSEMDNLKQTQFKIDQILQNNQKVNDALEIKIKESNHWKQKYEMELEQNQKGFCFSEEYNRLIENLKKKQGEIDQLNLQIFKIESENQQIYQTIQTKDEIIDELGQNYSENKRLEEEVVKKSQMILKRKENEFIDEINQYSIQIKNAVEEREKWKYKYIETEKQRGEYRVKSESLQQEIQLLQQENERFSIALKGRHQDIEKIQSTLFANQQSLEEKKSQLKEHEYLKSAIELKNMDNEELKSKNTSLQIQIEHMKKNISQLEEQLNNQTSNIQENQSYKQKITHLERSLNEQIITVQNLNEKLHQLKIVEQEKQKLEINYKNMLNETSKAKEYFQNLEKEFKISQNDNRLLTENLQLIQKSQQEHFKLQEQYKSNLAQIEQIQSRFQNLQLEMEVEKNDKNNFKNQIVMLNERLYKKEKVIEEQQRLTDKLDTEMTRNAHLCEEVIQFNRLLDQNTKDLGTIKLENQNLKGQLQCKNEQISQLMCEQNVFQKEKDRLMNQITMKNSQIDLLQIQIQELETKTKEQKCDNIDRNDKMIIFSQEIDRLNGSLVKRMKEIELLRQRQIFSEGIDTVDFKLNTKGSQVEKEYIIPQCSKMSQMQFQEIQTETFIINLQAQNEQLQKQYEQIEQQIERKDNLLSHKQKEYEQLKQKIEELNKKQESMYIQEDQNKVLEIEICQLKKDKELLLQEIHQIKYKYTEFSHLTFKVQELQYQLVLARIALESQASEIKHLRK